MYNSSVIIDLCCSVSRTNFIALIDLIEDSTDPYDSKPREFLLGIEIKLSLRLSQIFWAISFVSLFSRTWSKDSESIS